MNRQDYNAMRRQQAEAICRSNFGFSLQIKETLFDDIETGEDSYCVLFRTDRYTIYGLFISKQKQTLADIRRMARSMGLEAESYLPPFADPFYFRRQGLEIFQNAYPGRTRWTEQEAAYYQTLAIYNPALVKVKKIAGEIRRYNPYGNGWQKVFELHYEKMKVRQ